MNRETSDTGHEPRVKRLSGALIDQIAAGEVVERPASVVKELVENALDAGAERLRIEVRGGGRDWIAVTDDGHGMTPEDARLALQRHATSKIAHSRDLQRIGTYGFRGEALPAIASVSNLRLRTRNRASESAFEIRNRAGEEIAARAVGGPIGTRVEVADLFEAVPARRKFLKKDQTEWAHIADWLARLALALPGVHFDIHRDDRPVLSWPAARDSLDRIATVLGEEEAAALLAVEHEEGRARVDGYVSRPDRHRATAASIHLFVNRRPVRDRILQHALVDVYRDLLPRGRYPSAVLFVTVPPEAVDVNVHPAKREVRFADTQWAHRLVRNALLETIERRSWVGERADAPMRAALPEGGERSPGTSAFPNRAVVADSVKQSTMGDWVFASPRDAQPDGASESEAAPVRFADLRVLGQFLATYLIVEAKDRLLLIDQHAAHERVLYERLRADWQARGVERQGLLAPLTITLSPGALGFLEDGTEPLERLGFELERFGDDTLIVRAVPALLADHDPADLVRGLVDELQSGGGAAPAGRSAVRALPAADRIFATLACHASRRKGDVLGEREQRAVLDGLDAIPWAPTCPHGRPVCVPFELAEIERRFGRR